ncbi:porin [Burkholderia sp. MSh2]|uniref:Putative porin protein n=1 Tax=Burkholderia paludis TaxID=1506587 RepID=A0A6J5F5U1_9BURK|nr:MULTISPECIES: porin [Burkholderia]KEZ00761.1 porin [Burkholderia sp. MSh2]CAB3774198.1 Outer membrane porin protein 32 [Burkholderia paludis]VWC48532.1 putative porin protein [Burkholderia paludis]
MQSTFNACSAALLVVLAASAHAQSSVTLYGAIDTGLMYQSTAANNHHVFALKDGGIYASFWGLRGSEDLGGGYAVRFRLQGAFNSSTGQLKLSDTTGGSAAFNQQSTIGLSGPFGTIDLGRQFVPMIYAMAETDVRGAQYFGSILSAWLGLNQIAGAPGTNTNVPIGALYDSNAIVYRSPTMRGLSFSVEYAPGGVPGQFQGGTRESAVLRYNGYGLDLDAAYYVGHDTSQAASTPTGLANNRFYYVGAKYTLRGVSVSASYGRARNPVDAGRHDYDMISGGLGYRITQSLNVTSGVYVLRDRNHSQNRSNEYAVGAEYTLSRGTIAYVQGAYVLNRGAMSQIISYGQPVAPGVSTTAAMIGIRHLF